MVQFLVSIVFSLILIGAAVWYMKRRPADAVTTWGEAMAGAFYVFLVFFLVYGVVPHYWLNWADGDLSWRPDKIVYGPGNILKPQADGGPLPVTISYQTLRDIIAVGIYGVFIGANVALWTQWQNRGKTAPAEPVSEYGRPLVREGV